MSRAELKKISPRKRVLKSDPPPGEKWFSKTQKIAGAITACLVLLGMLWSYGSKADARYAKATVIEEMKRADAVAYAENKYTSDRLDIKIMQDRRNELDTRLYRMKSMPKAPAQVKDEIRLYEKEVKELDNAIDTKQKQLVLPTK